MKVSSHSYHGQLHWCSFVQREQCRVYAYQILTNLEKKKERYASACTNHKSRHTCKNTQTNTYTHSHTYTQTPTSPPTHTPHVEHGLLERSGLRRAAPLVPLTPSLLLLCLCLPYPLLLLVSLLLFLLLLLLLPLHSYSLMLVPLLQMLLLPLQNGTGAPRFEACSLWPGKQLGSPRAPAAQPCRGRRQHPLRDRAQVERPAGMIWFVWTLGKACT